MRPPRQPAAEASRARLAGPHGGCSPSQRRARTSHRRRSHLRAPRPGSDRTGPSIAARISCSSCSIWSRRTRRSWRQVRRICELAALAMRPADGAPFRKAMEVAAGSARRNRSSDMPWPQHARRCTRLYPPWLAPVPVPYRKKGPEIKDWPTCGSARRGAALFQRRGGRISALCSGRLGQSVRRRSRLRRGDRGCGAVAENASASGGLDAGGASALCLPQAGHAKSGDPFKDPSCDADAKAARLLELRLGADDKAAQTIFPRSVHESGEAITWDVATMTRSPADARRRRAGGARDRVAAAALLIRYWPPKGNRHELSLALGGVLARVGWDVAAIETFVGVVVHAANDPRPDDRVRCARDAAENVAARGTGFRLSQAEGNSRRRGLGQARRMARPCHARRRQRSGPVIRLTRGPDRGGGGGRARDAWRRPAAVSARRRCWCGRCCSTRTPLAASGSRPSA